MQSRILSYSLIIIFIFGTTNCYYQDQGIDAISKTKEEKLKSNSTKATQELKEISSNNIPTLIITEYEELDQSTGQLIDKLEEIQTSNRIKIAPSISAFTLHFTLLDKFYSSNNGYAYKIVGLENDWNDINENYVRIYNLPYGSYVLTIKGRRYNGEWADKTLSIPIEVLKPYYLTWWFFVSIGLIIMALSFLLFKNRLIRLEKTKKELETLVHQRTQKIEEDKILIEQQNKELAALNQTKDKLFTIIAHDLKDPANTFIGLSKKLRYLIQHQQWERLESFGGYMEQSADSLHKMLSNLLIWASTQQEMICCKKEQFFLMPLIQEILPVYEIKAQEHGIFIHTKMEQSSLTLFADREMVAIILRNILDNALKFSKNGGTIQLQVHELGQEIIISIQDEGIGIPIEIVPHLFSINQEKIRYGLNGVKGAGLGLSLCKELIEMNNGIIKMEQTNSKGTKMTLIFPNPLFIKELTPIKPSFYEV